MGIRSKLVVLVTLALLPCLLLLGHTIGRDRAIISSEAQKDLLPVARLLAGHHQLLLESAHGLLDRAAQDPRVRRFDPGACKAFALEFMKENPGYANVAVLRPDGGVFCSALPAASGVNARDRGYFKEALATRGFVLGGYQIGRVSGRPSIPAAHAVVEAGRVKGVIVASMDLAHLSRLVLEAGLPEGSAFAAFNKEGTVIIRYPDPELWVGKSVAGHPLAQEIRRRREGTVRAMGFDGVERFYGFTPLGGPGSDTSLAVGKTTSRVLSRSRHVRNSSVLGLLLAIPLTLLGTLWYAERAILRRVERAAEAARRFAHGDLNARTGLSDDDEIGRMGVALDQAAVALRRLLEQNRLILESTAEGICGVDGGGVVTFANAASARLFSLPQSSLVGRHIHGVVSLSSDPQRCPVFSVLGDGLPRSGECVAARPEGASIPVEYGVSPIENGGERVGAVVVLRDVSGRKRLEGQVNASQRLESIGRLAGGVAHDFNNILTAINGYADFLVAALPQGDPRRSDALEIKKAGERAAGLTRQLLAFSRRQVVKPKLLDLNELVAGIEKMLRRLMAEDVELVLRLEDGLSRVMADPGQVEQVIMNLAVNARDAMPKGGRILIETGLRRLDEDFVSAHPGAAPGSYVALCVGDTGTGIAPEHLPHIFEPFFTTKEEGKGTGLGLSTVYGIVKQSGGTIAVETEVGRGTTFRVYLPARDGSAQAEAEPAAAPARRADGTILLVEDDASVRAFARRALAARGYEVLEASSAEEALELVASHGPRLDLLLTDVVMPGLRGPELARRVLQSLPGLKVLYMSGYADEALGPEAGLKPDALVQKPVDAAALIAKVAQALARPSARD